MAGVPAAAGTVLVEGALAAIRRYPCLRLRGPSPTHLRLTTPRISSVPLRTCRATVVPSRQANGDEQRVIVVSG